MRLIANVIRISRAKLHCNRLLASQDKSHFFGTRCRGRVKISHKPQYMNTVTLLTNGRWLFATVFDYAPSVRPLLCRRNQSWAVSHDKRNITPVRERGNNQNIFPFVSVVQAL